MNKIVKLVTENKKTALICLFLVIVFVGCSAVSAVHVAQQRAVEMQTQEEAVNTETETEDTEDDVALTDSQQNLIENYDTETEDFIETLSASVWVANGGDDTLKFSDNQYIETMNGKTEKHSYAISRLEQQVDTSGIETNTVAFETDNGTHIVTYTNDRAALTDESSSVASTISSSSMFALKDTAYERADAIEEISIKGLNSDITTLLGDDASALTSSLSQWCAVHYPSVSEATWNNVAAIDWENDYITTDFTLNSDNPTVITAIYHKSTGEFEFSL